MFGFTVYNGPYNQARSSGEFPFPCPKDRVLGGHAVVAVGYDDDVEITNNICEGKPEGKPTKGALLIRNSWGTRWGENGYGWLPYSYVEAGLAVDFWSLIESEFVPTDLFE